MGGRFVGRDEHPVLPGLEDRGRRERGTVSTMNDRRWYAADALMADLTNHHHHLRASSEAEVERRMRDRYPEAVAILVRRKRSRRQILSG